MQNKTDFISLSHVIDEWTQDVGLTEEALDQETLKRWALDAASWLSYADNLKHKIKLLSVGKLGKVKLPDDFSSVCQIAYKKNKSKEDSCTTIEQVSTWVQHDHLSGVDVEIKIKCPKCGTNSCTCDTGAIEIDIDPLWRAHNPFHDYFGKFGRQGSFGRANGSSIYHDSFMVMRYAGGDFHAINHHIPECHNLNAVGSDHKYSIELPYINTDIREEGTQILLAYMANPVDEYGDLMIPMIPDAIDAVKFQMTYKYFYRKYHQTLENKYQSAYRTAEMARENAIELARSSLNQLGFHETYAMFSEVLYKHHTNTGDKYRTFGMENVDHRSKWLR
jgi:hypothetical protein